MPRCLCIYRACGVWAVVGLALLSTAASAVTIHDAWARAGGVQVDGDGWDAAFARGASSVAFSKGDYVVGVAPLSRSGQTAGALESCQRRDDHSVCATFASEDGPVDLTFVFEDYGTVAVSTSSPDGGVAVACRAAIGIMPGYRLEDVLYAPAAFPDCAEVYVPVENWFAALLEGEGGMLACAWDGEGQGMVLDRADDAFSRIRLALNGETLHFELLVAPGLWHLEPLALDYLEKDIAIDWQRPFPAVYRTQLPLHGESTTWRTFLFWDHAGEQWRPETGAHVYPAYFDGDRAHLCLSKRIPPKGDAVIYPYEDGAVTLLGFLYRTPVAERIVARGAGRPFAPGPRGAPNVGFNACWGTWLLRRTVYTYGLQASDTEFLREHGAFLTDYVAQIQQRNRGYFDDLAAMRTKLDSWLMDEQSGDVRAFLDAMVAHADDVEEGHRNKVRLYDEDSPEEHIAHANRNLARLEELLGIEGDEAWPEFQQLLDEFNRMAWGNNESTGMRFSMLMRAWAQDAAVGCADLPEAVDYARAIRADVRQALNSDSGW
ncbi:MAG TPA: hypothetical protein PLO37_26290 [Candidatus Hydrogenedentes bacterium]|nr:hypothetical protein [Candidatus Hydrogenedentota bacterium]HPG70365.1 hypothetical protein [Candidatus Hydrogenedentota bacterium]